jgi:hypothetical protein
VTTAELAIFTAALVPELRERDAVLPLATVANLVEAAHVASAVTDSVVQRLPGAVAALEARAAGDDDEAMLARRTLFRLREMVR